MSDVLLNSILTLGSVGVVSAIILYFVAQKFKVYEDPRIDDIEEALPSANCGGCGYPGCRAFAEACAKADNLDNLYCPVGGNDVMKKVAEILGQEVKEQKRQVAVVRCAGSYEHRAHHNIYEGPENCAVVHQLYGGETDCHYGCLGLADCVRACDFDALHMDEKTGLPVVDEDKCTACGACVEACPRDIIELRVLGPRDRKIFVSCINEDPAGPAKKACSVACIGCGLCYDACKFDAITMTDNLAYIDDKKCVLCRACVEVCPTNAIWEVNFPPRKPRPAKKKTATKQDTAKQPEKVENKQTQTAQDNKAINISELPKEENKTENKADTNENVKKDESSNNENKN